jgi:DNA-binding SARP family transcriptional activator
MLVDASPPSPAPVVDAHLLGPTRLALGERVIPGEAWSRRSARSLLLLLLVTPDHRLTRDQVIERLWPDIPLQSADQALRKAVHLLRRVLEPRLKSGRNSAYLSVGVDNIALRCDLVRVDRDTFETLLLRGESASLPERRTLLRQALSLYQGDLLRDEPYAEWAESPRRYLRHLRRRAVLDLAALDADAGEPVQSLSVLQQLFQEDETGEVVLRALMRGLADTGMSDDAIHWYRSGVSGLRGELGVEPESETEELIDRVRAMVAVASPPLPGDMRIRPHARVPVPPTPITGRVREIDRLQDLLLDEDVRLVTLTGPGGVGKTRLAQEVARRLSEDFSDGVCFVALAAVRDVPLVLPTIAHALGVGESGQFSIVETIAVALQEREMLLVLDNTEQILDAAPESAVLLERCDRLTILATSREPLRLRAEHEVPVSPLALPDITHPDGYHAIARYEAVELFARRAVAVGPDFTLDDENAGAIATLCGRLDGLPLAIELAAAQVRTMSPERLLAGMGDRFALLASGYRDLPSRQQSLRGTIAWSYDLLPSSRRALFRKVSVFAGGFTCDAVEQVIGCTTQRQGETSHGRPHALRQCRR